MSQGPNPHQTTGGQEQRQAMRHPNRQRPPPSQAQRDANAAARFGQYLLPYNMPIERGVLSISKSALPAPNPVYQYDKFVANFNRRYALAEMREMMQPGGAGFGPNDTGRLLMNRGEEVEITESEIISATHWKVIQDSVRQNHVWSNVYHFVSKMRDLPVKKKVPYFVKKKLAHKLPSCWEDDTLGWSPWRLDVLFNDFAHLVFNCVAIFLFSTRVVLYKVDMDAFPALYIIMLGINAFYRCNTKVLTYEQAIVTRKKIIQNYLWKYAILDCTLVYLCLLQISRVETTFFRMIIFLKLIENYKITNKLTVASNVFPYGMQIMKIVRIYLHVLTLIHIVALNFIVMVSKDKHPNWMDNFNYTRDMDHWITVYIRAFYWATATLTYCAYGDTTPQRTKEVVVCFFVQVFGIAVVAYWLNSLQTIFQEIRQCSIHNSKNMRLINRFLEGNKVGYHIQKQVKKSMNRMTYAMQAEVVKEENDLIGTLSPWIKDRLLENVHIHRIMTMPFWNRYSMDSLKAICTQIERKLYYQTELIIAQDQVPQRLFMLRNGKVDMIYADEGMNVTKVGRLSYIHGVVDKFNRLQANVPNHYIWLGLDFTIREMECPYSIRATRKSLVYYCELSKVINILIESEDDRDYEGYCLFRDSIKFGQLKVHQVSCLHCPGADHTILQCPYYHFTPKKDFVINKYIVREGAREKYKLMERVLQPGLKGNNTRRSRFPWIKIGGVSDNIVVGSLSSNRAQAAGLEKYRAIARKTIAENAMNPNKIDDYLTTLKNFETPRQWKTYWPKYNVSNISLRVNPAR